MPPVVFCLCPNCSCYSPVFNISDDDDIKVAENDAADAFNFVASGEAEQGSSRIGENLFGLLSFLGVIVLLAVGKYANSHPDWLSLTHEVLTVRLHPLIFTNFIWY
jgi:hypothetical protein